ncbi:uncharacterized protein MKZ38_002729 [Zalerion maritima]|uniref:Uncharacterized protein n=1 Tax=Zalerion maritima TaxID=339359 RepID=A0AAD5RPL2_9PEZI|nr:uncharacterized protein MKZ38_002729 [Zalerion maritima]
MIFNDHDVFFIAFWERSSDRDLDCGGIDTIDISSDMGKHGHFRGSTRDGNNVLTTKKTTGIYIAGDRNIVGTQASDFLQRSQ